MRGNPVDLCGAKTRKGTSCKHEAGWGTHHVGDGKCRLHGGASRGAPIKHGRYSLTHRQALQAKSDQFLDDPMPGDLTAELALLRALMQEYLGRFPDPQPLPLSDISAVYGMVDSIGRLVERISKILNSSALNQAEVAFLMVRFADLMSRYIDDPDKRARFLGELGNSTGLRRLVGSAVIDQRTDERRATVGTAQRSTDSSL